MSVDPNEIFLSDDQRRLLATAADEAGLPWQSLLNQAIVPLVHQPAPNENGALRMRRLTTNLAGWG